MCSFHQPGRPCSVNSLTRTWLWAPLTFIINQSNLYFCVTCIHNVTSINRTQDAHKKLVLQCSFHQPGRPCCMTPLTRDFIIQAPLTFISNNISIYSNSNCVNFSPQHVPLAPLLLPPAAESAPHALFSSPPLPMALLCVTAAGTPVELQLKTPATVSN